jgi:pimeloyl-ACP methyl ester carboxylesterase
VLIHGLSGSVQWWRRNLPALAQHFTVYAVELAGFASNRGRPLPMDVSAAGLAAFMDALGLECAHIVGHSMGGQISLHLAARHPQKVVRLVLAAPSGTLHRGIVEMSFRLARASRYEAADFVPTLVRDAIRAGPFNLLRAARTLLKDDVEQLLDLVQAPALVIAGEHDLLVPPELCKVLAAGIEHARYVELPRAGHNLMWDQADAFNTAVLAFLRDEAPPASLPVDQRDEQSRPPAIPDASIVTL